MRFLRWLWSWFPWRSRRVDAFEARPERDPYEGMPDVVRDKLIAQDKERILYASRQHEFGVIAKLDKAIPGIVGHTFPTTRGITVYVTLESFKDGLAPVYRQLAKYGYRVSRRYEPSGGQVNTEFKTDNVEAIINMYATSRECKRVKTGVRMEEVDVYEMVCE